MLPVIIHIDEAIFLFINNVQHTWVADQFFLFFSFYPLIIWLIIGMGIVWYEKRQDNLFIVRLVVALVLAGALATGVIKPLIKRPRPDITHGNEVVIVPEKPAVYPKSNDYAFPSGHAAVAFAGAYIVTQEERKKKSGKRNKKISTALIYLIATLTAFSRIYLGKHYPLDVVAGGVLGTGVGLVTWRLIDLMKPKLRY